MFGSIYQVRYIIFVCINY